MEKIHITKNHTGKMDGMQSISTSCLCNPACIARAQNGETVCSHCFAVRQFKRYGETFRGPFEKNAEILSAGPLEPEYIPRINAAVFRFESFGDLINPIHAANYFRIAAANPRTTFALWTKNPGYIDAAIRLYGAKKPKNLIIIYSSPRVNVPALRVLEVFPFIDKVFTVWDPEGIKKCKVDINCGARNCFTCGRCYSKRTGAVINEKLK